MSLLVRVFYLNHHDFWFDEAFSWFVASKNFKDIVIASIADNHPPLYYLILHLWMYAFGNSEVALRSLSLVFGILSVLVFYNLVKTFNERSSLLATLFFSISPLAVYYSAETRMYSLFLLLTLCSVYVWIKLLKKINKFHTMAFIITLTASVYAHYLSFLLFIPFFFTAFMNKKTKYLIIILVAAAIFTAPLLLAYSMFHHPQSVSFSPIVALPISFASFVLGGTGIVSLRYYFSDNIPIFIKGIFLISLLAFNLFFLLGLVRTFKDKNKTNFFYFLLAPLITLSIFGFVIPIFSIRASIFLVPYFFIFIVWGIYKTFPKQIILLSIPLVTSLLVVDLFTLYSPALQGPEIKKAVYSIPDYSQILHTSVLTYYSFAYYNNTFNNILITQNPLSEETVNVIGGSTQKAVVNKPNTFLIEVVNGTDPGQLANINKELIKNTSKLEYSDLYTNIFKLK